MSFRIAVVFAALLFLNQIYASTLPLAVGNHWTYSHQDSIVDGSKSDEDIPMPAELACTTKVGILAMTVLSVAEHADSTLFTLSFSDSGKMSVWGNSGWSAPFAYTSLVARKYLIVNNSLFLEDSNGAWNSHFDVRILCASQHDTAYTWEFGTFQRKTTPFTARVGTDSALGYEKTESTNSNAPLMGTRAWADTFCWADKFGLVASAIHDLDIGSSLMGGGYWFELSMYKLLAFRNNFTGLANRSPGRSKVSISPVPARRCILGSAAFSRFSRKEGATRFFSVTGKRVANRMARQIVIVAP